MGASPGVAFASVPWSEAEGFLSCHHNDADLGIPHPGADVSGIPQGMFEVNFL